MVRSCTSSMMMCCNHFSLVCRRYGPKGAHRYLIEGGALPALAGPSLQHAKRDPVGDERQPGSPGDVAFQAHGIPNNGTCRPSGAWRVTKLNSNTLG